MQPSAWLLAHVQNEIDIGLGFVRDRRRTFGERLRLYVDRQRSPDKVGDNTVYAAMQLSLALSYSDDMGVVFAPRGFGQDAYAENLTHLAQFDYEEMGLSTLNFQKDWDRFFFGVGIRVKTGWNAERKVPMWTVKDPMSWIPDPVGNFLDPFRFHYFEEAMFAQDMSGLRGFDQEAVQAVLGDTKTDEAGMINVYNGYTEYEGERLSVTVSADRGKILRAVRLTPDQGGSYEEMVNLTYFSPLRGDPFGVSLVDLLEDKQRANSILMNLRLIDAKFATFGQLNLFDSRAINKSDLTTPTLATKWIAFDSFSGIPISQAIYPVPRQNLTNDSLRMSQELATRIETETGINRDMLKDGQTGDAASSARFALADEVNTWAEKAFWKEWYRSYKRYFTEGESKFVRITGGLGHATLELRRDDFIGQEDPDITVANARKMDARQERQKLGFMAKLPLILNDPNLPMVTKRFALRKAYRLDGVSAAEVAVLVPPSFEETQAEAIRQAIDASEGVEAADRFDLGEDTQTYRVILGPVRATPLKAEIYKRIRAREVALHEVRLANGTSETPAAHNGLYAGLSSMTASQMGSAYLRELSNNS